MQWLRHGLFVLSLLTPVLSFYDSSDPSVQLASTVLTCFLVATSVCVNIFMQWRKGKLTLSAVGWVSVEVGKCAVAIFAASQYPNHNWSNAYWCNYALLLWLVLESMAYFVEIFRAPREMYRLLITRYHNIAWVQHFFVAGICVRGAWILLVQCTNTRC